MTRRSPVNRLRSQTALVTGASRGIGLAIAHRLGAEGCDLILTSRERRTLERIGRELTRKKIRVLTYPCDVRDPHSVDDLIRIVRRQTRRIDILVNNAGIAHANLPVERLPYPVWKDILATNLDGTFLITQAALQLIPRGGTIVNNLSIAATRVFAGAAAYTASKHAALGFTNTLREELRGKGIRVIGLMPGATETDIWNTLWPEAPRRKMLSPETVAEAVINAIVLPSNATVETLEILPSAGTL
ncbi:MAG TPA: SDR family NAD(P)-dependent oxidoreductase [Candidatus Binatia bacterium]|nr:SDR family NAD(P)-dependent oxidoreductase [Candidatus Binatia bacterium]